MPEASTPPVRCFTQADADPLALQDECVAVLGYGHLGQPFALNLRDSGVSSLVVGNIEDSYAEQARQEGFEVVPLAEAARRADIALVLLSDEVIPEVYAAQIAPHLKPGAAIVFGSGYTLGYGLIQPAANLDVLLLAPRMAGENARQRFQRGEGFYAYVNVEQDASGKAWRRLLGLASGVGILRAGALQLNARQEADLDLLIEQTVGAAVGVALMNAFFLGVEAGIPAEAMVMEMYMDEEMESVWRGFREVGLMVSSNAHGPTAMYGGFIRTMQLLNSDLTNKFRETWQEIQSGAFARQFQAEREAGYPMLAQAQMMAVADHPISQAEQRLRQMLAKK